ncbi:hypothetical protein [Fluviicola taffensis]|uniref:Outer membrane protein beta-barrel domain-containing protein n=1 Tax=Fluviicola taffensis (strain DSM 16823 / NCIMB 13979 / RW262) TaxID=755732 RepID=F2I9D3_FLUTR|nr:hypothetical protein [Fluviicola taffensis]AEA44090.1 hypothetical protein Fluta_2104 [Fluviicola taffensis DSM 16823]
MKKTLQLICIIFLSTQTIHAQLFVGAKGGYNRYFEPGMNGGNIALFTEVPLGEYYNSSVRASIFYDFPMKYEDVGTIYAYPDSYLFDDHVPVYSKYQNAGISVEYMHYFSEDAFESTLYAGGKVGFSYSTIKRTIGDFNTSDYYLNDYVKDNKQFSVYLGVCLGYQFALSHNSFLFIEFNTGFPFLQLNGSDAGSSSISGYPIIMVAGNIGFKQSIFN